MKDFTVMAWALAAIAVALWTLTLLVVWRKATKWLRKRQAKREEAMYEQIEDVVQQVLRDQKAVI